MTRVVPVRPTVSLAVRRLLERRSLDCRPFAPPGFPPGGAIGRSGRSFALSWPSILPALWRRSVAATAPAPAIRWASATVSPARRAPCCTIMAGEALGSPGRRGRARTRAARSSKPFEVAKAAAVMIASPARQGPGRPASGLNAAAAGRPARRCRHRRARRQAWGTGSTPGRKGGDLAGARPEKGNGPPRNRPMALDRWRWDGRPSPQPGLGAVTASASDQYGTSASTGALRRMQRRARAAVGQLHGQGPLAAAQRRIVRHRPINARKLQQAGDEVRRLAHR